MFLKKPKFWDNKGYNFISVFLLPFTLITSFINWTKIFHEKKKFKIKTICIGNIYIGGTGKTPLCIETFHILKKLRFRPVFIKKYYSNQKDEIELLSKNGPVISLNSRKKSLEIAETKKYDFAIIDDGLQDKTIDYDLKVLCFDKKNFTGNGKLIPAGPLREKLNAVKDCHLAFFNGPHSTKNRFKSILKKKRKDIQIFETEPKLSKIENLKKKDTYVIFSGIGNPKNFEFLLKKNKYKILESFEFPDHYNFKDEDIREISISAKKNNSTLLTTEKDFYRLKKNQKKNIKKINIKLKINNIKRYTEILKKI